MKANFVMIIALLLVQDVFAQSIPPLPQYPSPMQEHVRRHRRMTCYSFSGQTVKIEDLLPQPVDIYIPAKMEHTRHADLLIQFFGNNNAVSYAADHYPGRLIIAMVNLGSGSSVYAKPFRDSSLFSMLLDSIQGSLNKHLQYSLRFDRIIIGGFSAGYGAVRAILNVAKNRKIVDGVLLLDGLHADYVPDRKTLAEGGRIDSSAYTGILAFCRLAADNRSGKKFLFTHSEIFPGTFVSTTESAGFLAGQLGLKPHAVLKWGPGGMQQLSDTRKGRFRMMGFAGNTAPDHVDHMQNLYYFLRVLKKL